MQELRDDPDFALLSAEEQRELLRQKSREYFANRPAWTNAAFAEQLLSPRGVAFAFWVFCRKEQPSLTLEECRRLITAENCAEVFVRLNVASAMRDLGNWAGLSG